MFNLKTDEVTGSNENTTDERIETVDIIESAFQGATNENTQAIEEALSEPTDRPFRLLINADWDFATTAEDDMNLLKEAKRMLSERVESGQEVEIVTAGYRRGSSNMVEHFATLFVADHDMITHRVVEPTKPGESRERMDTYRRNRFLARYCDAALLFKASTEENRMSQHMDTCFQEWTPASRNGQAKRVVVKTREQLS